MRIIAAGLTLFLIGATPAPSAPFKQFVIATPSIGAVVEVTPGQEFYVETIVEAQPAYRLSRPFKSSMAGGMGLPFGFAIDETLLVYKGKSQDQQWSYYVPQNGGFRAYHGLLGNLIHPGDTVGLRIDSGGNKEWFVDLSVHYGMPTIWSRPVKEKDPGLTLVEGPAPDLKNAEMRRLVYLGVEQGRMRIRYEWIQHGYVPQRDEFSFPVDPQGRGQGGVKGAEFSVVAGAVKAKFVVTKGISDAVPVQPRPEPESERAIPAA